MPRADSRLQRLYLRLPLRAGGRIEVTREQANYLLNVLRMGEGDELLVFNGHDGEWIAKIAEAGRRACVLAFVRENRPQPPASDLHYLFAPLKMARLDYMVQKAVEMGAGALRPVITRHTQVGRVNRERMEANVFEAAEQCGILAVPTVAEPVELKALLDAWPGVEGERRIIFCDEGEAAVNPMNTLAALPRGPIAVLIGPEGGFSDEERHVLRSKSFVTAISLGPRILRADTAAVAALAVVQAALGDW
jgi:16S rRNA (uracil1498-N3)-methyltransferase